MKDNVLPMVPMLPLVPIGNLTIKGVRSWQRESDWRRVDLPLEKAVNAALALREIADALDPPGGFQSDRDCELLTLAVVAGEELVQALAQIGMEVK